MLKVVQDKVESNGDAACGCSSVLDEIAREGARRMLAAALRAEADAYVDALTEVVDEDGHRTVVRNGHAHARTVIGAARAVGRRAIVSRGWVELALTDPALDGLSVGEVNHQALFPRVAAVVHHGGAGATTAAPAPGRPRS